MLAELPRPVLVSLLTELGSMWRLRARNEQLPPTDWRTWYVRGGRGSGKTWTGSNVLAEMALDKPGEYGVVAPTDSAVRDVCLEGPSGLLRAYGTNLSEVKRGASRVRRELQPDDGAPAAAQRLDHLRRWCGRWRAHHSGQEPARAVGRRGRAVAQVAAGVGRVDPLRRTPGAGTDHRHRYAEARPSARQDAHGRRYGPQDAAAHERQRRQPRSTSARRAVLQVRRHHARSSGTRRRDARRRSRRAVAANDDRRAARHDQARAAQDRGRHRPVGHVNRVVRRSGHRGRGARRARSWVRAAGRVADASRRTSGQAPRSTCTTPGRPTRSSPRTTTAARWSPR